MALNRLKNELNPKPVPAAKKRTTVVAPTHAEIEKRRVAFELLYTLEPFFWECVKDFAKLSRLPVRRRSRSILYPLIRVSRRKSRLHVSLEPVSFCGLSENDISLYAAAELGFWAYNTGYPNRGSSYREADVSSTLRGDYSNVEKAKEWLETQFERYYRKIEALQPAKDRR